MATKTPMTRTAALAYATKRAQIGTVTLLACVNKQFAKSVCTHCGYLSTSEIGQEIMATYIKAHKSRLNRAA
jgi:hypothetical protein